MSRSLAAVVCLLVLGLPAVRGTRQNSGRVKDLDARVTRFLEEHRFGWRDMNVPESDGRLLHDLVITHAYKRALEIGRARVERVVGPSVGLGNRRCLLAQVSGMKHIIRAAIGMQIEIALRIGD